MSELLNDFSPGLFFVQIILLLVMILLLGKFAWKPIITALNDREEGIKNALDSAEKARREMENLQADNENLLKEARAEREAMLKEARELKVKIIDDAKLEAKEEADKLLTQAQNAIETEKKAAVVELKSQVAGLTIDLAQKIVKNELSNKDKQLKLVETMLDETNLN